MYSFPCLQSTHLKGQITDDARHSKANQQQVCEDEGSGGVDDLLDLFARAAGLAWLSAEEQSTMIRLLPRLSFLERKSTF